MEAGKFLSSALCIPQKIEVPTHVVVLVAAV